MDTPRRTRIYHSHHLDSERWDHLTLRPGDVVISTSMKAGTTWMQRIMSLLVFGTGHPRRPGTPTEGRCYLGVDVLARSRITLIDTVPEVTHQPALTA